MRRRLAIILILILTTIALARAQEALSFAADDTDRPPPAEPWRQMIAGQWIPLELEWTPGPPEPGSPALRAVPATDSCGNAPALNLACIAAGA